VLDAEGFDDDASNFTTMSVNDAVATDIFGNLETPPDDEDAAEPANQIDQSTPNFENDTEQIAQNPIPAEVGGIAALPLQPPNIPPEPTPTSTAPMGPTIPKSRSLAHFKFKEKKVVFVSFDIETGGEHCGILQISAEMVRVDVEPSILSNGNESNMKDSSSNIRREAHVFNKYIKPEEGAIFDSIATRVHGLVESDPRIQGADGMERVWPQFLEWFIAI